MIGCAGSDQYGEDRQRATPHRTRTPPPHGQGPPVTQHGSEGKINVNP